MIPGLALAGVLGGVTWYRAKQVRLPASAQGLAGASAGAASATSIWGLLLIVVVMGGIYSGIFTPTEAAAMSAVYAFIVAVFIYKDMGLKDVPKVLLNSANMSAMLLYIITNAVLFSFIMTNEEHSAGAGRLDAGQRLRRDHLPAGGERHPAARRQLHGAVLDRADLRPHPVPGGDRRWASTRCISAS